PAVTSMLRMKKGTDLFSVDEKHRFLDALQIRYPKAIRAKTQAEAILAAQTIGLPVALKIASPEILHKTDAGGVRLDIRSAGELRKAYGEVTRSAREYRPDARILGVDVEEMVPPGVEVIIGGIRDPQFGPVVMCGLGGIFVETTRDVVFEIAPVTCNGARRMLESIRGYPVLKGVRGRQGVDLESLTKVIVSISEVIASHPEIDEIELNPLMAYPSGVIAVDARIIPASGKEPTH
ncbi:MAG TPA: acetate--CoA ligase family protein, partial [Nitrospirota bacterium]|nr:acetate--CoA ligase family protein [Nitrospirota bacterium]